MNPLFSSATAEWLTPPYGSAINAWIRKAMDEVEEGNATVVLALVAARTETRWFRPLFQYPIAFITGRLAFIDAETQKPQANPTFPSAVVMIRNAPRKDHVMRFARALHPMAAIHIPNQWSGM